MTDFFADLEREIRAAHPRRPRPAVPVKGIAASAAVAATLVAVVLALGQLTSAPEQEVAQPPPSAHPGWTEYAPLDCDGRVVDGRIPEELVDRFAILRGDAPSFELGEGAAPDEAALVIRQSLRRVDGPGGRVYVFAVVRMAAQDCSPGPHAVCLISLETSDAQCQIPGADPVLGYIVEPFAEGRRVVAVIADDDVRRVSVVIPQRTAETPFDIEASTGFQVIPGGPEDPRVTNVSAPATEERDGGAGHRRRAGGGGRG